MRAACHSPPMHTTHSPFTGGRLAVYHDVTCLPDGGIDFARANGDKVYSIGADYYIGDLPTLRVMAADAGEQLYLLTESNNLVAVKSKK